MTKILLTIAGVAATAAAVAGTAGSAPPAKKLTIQHVVRGCHVWSDGSRRAATMSVALRRGGTLTIVDMDIDPHQLVQVSGPRLGLRGHMMMGGIDKVVFRQAGLYRLTTRTL